MFNKKARIKVLEEQIDTQMKQIKFLLAYVHARGLWDDLESVVDEVKRQEEANQNVH